MRGLIEIILVFLAYTIRVYDFIVLIYVLMSWFPIDRNNPLAAFIIGLVEPVYKWLLSFLPPLRFQMFDLSILYLFLLVEAARWTVWLIIRLVIGV